MPFLPSSSACPQQFSLQELSTRISVTKTHQQMALQVRSRLKRNHNYKHTLMSQTCHMCINIYELLQQLHHYIFAIIGISVCILEVILSILYKSSYRLNGYGIKRWDEETPSASLSRHNQCLWTFCKRCGTFFLNSLMNIALRFLRSWTSS